MKFVIVLFVIALTMHMFVNVDSISSDGKRITFDNNI